MTVVRDRKIRTALRTNQIPGFVTVTSWKKIKNHFLPGVVPAVAVVIAKNPYYHDGDAEDNVE